jgi:hypothetical protein
MLSLLRKEECLKLRFLEDCVHRNVRAGGLLHSLQAVVFLAIHQDDDGKYLDPFVPTPLDGLYSRAAGGHHVV